MGSEKLKSATAMLNRVTGKNYIVEKFFNQGYRVELNNAKISPILPTQTLIIWIEAFVSGFESAK